MALPKNKTAAEDTEELNVVAYGDIDSWDDLEPGDVVSFSKKEIKAAKRAEMIRMGVAGGVGFLTGVGATLAYQEVSSRLSASSDVASATPIRQTAANR